MPDQKTCFVIMGFGEKTDYETQRTLDLDKSYHNIIKPAVEACDVECIRADEIIHSGVIDKPMYEHLLEADLVVADLSTSNQNAIYELGVRHALRPNTTIVIAEKNFSFPFDLGHVVIRTYEHLGTGIDFDEVMRMRSELTDVIRATVLDGSETDSPVYTFLSNLTQPQAAAGKPGEDAVAAAPDGGESKVFGVLLEKAKEAMSDKDFATAKVLFRQLLDMNRNDQYACQQLALATYKHKEPTEKQGLLDARQILADRLKPGSTNDPETLGLWGAVHKRLWELDGDRPDLDTAIGAYERGFYLKRDYYNGINYAFMLNVRASVQDTPDEATADRVLANRVRGDVLGLVDEAERALPRDEDGLGEVASDEEESEVTALKAPAGWMPDSTREQLSKLRSLL